ncbi:MAG: tRNA (N6-isopentenyl adenosine(37)-C2)-methylthiotransferase MiaB [Planctomycetaceae bacterium]|jgi:tRNA-2-methylthio-N6-dimethylallyladenosine synthase|nr:tRNA (N6-isopentenyl adenosine(37)-C2)-methylthiotransferase MiaB [Planctomycetaceae bacterium]
MPKFYIETVGCQMNVLDSELAGAALIRSGMEPADSITDADVILFNTCSVRQHAEDKVYSALGRLKQWKEQKPVSVLGIIGCMAQKDQKLIFQRVPYADLVLGPGQLDVLAETVRQLFDAKSGGRKPSVLQRVCVSLPRNAGKHHEVIESFRLYNPERMIRGGLMPAAAGSPSLVRIMFGCNQFCSYCIVPYVRGPEQSRPPQDILNEVKLLADGGAAKITFIGQTVNSYCYNNNGKITKLADLLYLASETAGVQQIDFVTNYPLGIDDRLLQAVRDLPKVVKHFHVPAQSGSDTVLQRMNRHYTSARYREMTDQIYETVPGATMTSDFIVGFCGETDAEFEQTVDLVKYCRFRNSFIFKYSGRKGTKSAELYADDVPEEVKKHRNNRLLEVQIGISRRGAHVAKHGQSESDAV